MPGVSEFAADPERVVFRRFPSVGEERRCLQNQSLSADVPPLDAIKDYAGKCDETHRILTQATVES
jgi:hypothetical protein